jgi:hypothetical protein
MAGLVKGFMHSVLFAVEGIGPAVYTGSGGNCSVLLEAIGGPK